MSKVTGKISIHAHLLFEKFLHWVPDSTQPMMDFFLTNLTLGVPSFENPKLLVLVETTKLR